METQSENTVAVSSLSDKSRSLRKTSVKKRLETELKKVSKKRKEKHAKKPRLNKYQRKVANAKERERMKRMNEVFERLKKVVPIEQLNAEDGKDKKVTILRSAIVYIQSLKQLISDCDANLLDQALYNTASSPAPSTGRTKGPGSKQSKVQTSSSSKVKTSKRVILESKWTNYSQQFLQDKFSARDGSPESHQLSEGAGAGAGARMDTEDVRLDPAELQQWPRCLQHLPHISELLGGGGHPEVEAGGGNIQIHIQLIEDSKLMMVEPHTPALDMETYTDMAAYSQCLSL